MDAHGWRPIETAPHATDVLLFIPATTHTSAKQEVGFASGGERIGAYSSRWYHGWATHWQPLPPPPEGALDRMIAEAEKRGYKEGWNDREGDLLNGIDRVYGAEASRDE